ncbi:MAG TPA: SprT family zinc-dependent metalloprotease [Ktedonobacterales bacterium]|nr:SprT family zinc-dependent metalloprotease [Ktedonobacterales bacterium]
MEFGGRRVDYALRVSPKARRLRMVIRAGSGLEVVVPRGMPLRAHEPFMREKAAWILQTLDRLGEATPARAEPPLATGSRLRCAGRELTLQLGAGTRAGHYRAALQGDTLHLGLPDLEQDTIHRALEHWYRRQAETVFAERLARHNAVYQYRYAKVTIKAQKTRWGSCSRQGNLNFNWRLLLAPLAVLDYVVIHELCHLREMNHSSRFWQLVAVACPDFAVQRRWLRAQGQQLDL